MTLILTLFSTVTQGSLPRGTWQTQVKKYCLLLLPEEGVSLGQDTLTWLCMAWS